MFEKKKSRVLQKGPLEGRILTHGVFFGAPVGALTRGMITWVLKGS